MRAGLSGFVCLLFLTFVTECAHAATTYYLPRRINTVDMQTTGIALVNPTTGTATAVFRLRDAQGSGLNTAQRSIPANGQIALTISQIFPDETLPGWLSVDVDVDWVSGFWLGGNFVNSTDGATLLTIHDAESYPPFTFFSSSSEISLVNLGASTATGNLTLIDSTGHTAARNVPFSVPPYGLYQNTVAAMYPDQASKFDSAGYWIAVNSDASTYKLIGAIWTPAASGDNMVANKARFSAKQFLFPHVVAGQVGGSTYSTVVTLTNFFNATVSVTLTLRQTSGAVATAQKSIAPYGVMYASLDSLFGLPSMDGWLLVNSTGNIGGYLSYTDTTGGGRTAVEGQSQAANLNLVFGHIADLDPWWTGIALVNSSTTPSRVEVYAIDPSGNLIGGPAQSSAASFTIPGQSKKTFLLSEVIPATQKRKIDGGYIYVRSTNSVGLYGTELFFLRSGKVFANVPGSSITGAPFNIPTSLASTSVQITLAPAPSFIQLGSTQSFSATVSGTTNTAITWSVNGIAGGNSSVGTISADGIYTAPAALPSPPTVTIRAASAADPSAVVDAHVTIVPPTCSGTTPSIAGLSSTTPLPLTRLFITTCKLDAAAPITLKFSNSAGFSVIEDPVRVDSSGNIVAGVPLYLDPSTNQIAQGAVSLVLMQGSTSSAPVSLTIQNLPPLSAFGTPLGQISHAFLVFESMLEGRALNILQAARILGASTSTASAESTTQTFLDTAAAFRADVDAVRANPSTVINWGTLSDGTHLQFDRNQLDLMDRILGMYITQEFAGLSASSSVSRPDIAAKSGSPDVVSHQEPAEPDQQLNALIDYFQSKSGPAKLGQFLMNKPRPWELGTAFAEGLAAPLKLGKSPRAAGFVGMFAGFNQEVRGVDAMTHDISSAGCFLASQCSGNADEIQQSMNQHAFDAISGIVKAVSNGPAALGLASANSASTAGKVVGLFLKSLALDQSGATAGVENTFDDLVVSNALQHSIGGLAFNPPGPAPSGQGSVSLVVPGAGGFAISTITDNIGGGVAVFPVGVSADYSKVTLTATDLNTSAQYYSTVFDGSSILPNVTQQIALPATGNSTSSGPTPNPGPPGQCTLQQTTAWDQVCLQQFNAADNACIAQYGYTIAGAGCQNIALQKYNACIASCVP